MNGVETAIKFAPENLKGKIRLRSADIRIELQLVTII
jgi:hypothetical protein